MARDHRAHIDQNVATIASLREHAEEDLSAQQRGIESVTAALGQPRSIYVVIAVVLLWCGANVIGPRFGVQPFDPPPFLYLQGSIGFVALLTMIMVLTSQARQRKEAERNAHLDLQINLLAEQKIMTALDERLGDDDLSIVRRLELRKILMHVSPLPQPHTCAPVHR